MKKKGLIFVIQKHDATRLHYDFRIEVDGVLKSWAVPKGPSTDPRQKRLAIMTTDHSLKYAKFEGVIPEGEYGAGIVMVWDKGTYRNIKKTKDGKIVPIKKCLKEGQLEIWLNGKKLKGGYSIVRMNDKNWLLIKMKDEHADARRNLVKSQPTSVLTGKTLKDISKND